MWSTALFLLLVTCSMISLLIGIPSQVYAIGRMRELPAGALQATTVFGIIQNLVFAIIAAGLGIVYGRQAGLHAAVFEAMLSGLSLRVAIQSQLVPAVAIGTISGLIFAGLYFGVIRPQMNKETAIIVENLRLEMGLSSRVLIGGIHAEIVFRWGVMGILVWIGFKITGNTSPLVIWTAIVLAGLIFGLAHLPGAATLGIEPSRALITSSLILNLLAGTVFGWLFWQYGLFAAMIAHALYHVILYPFEHYFIDR